MERLDPNHLRLLHIRDAIEKVLEYSKDKSRPDFDNSTLLQDALVRELEIIGEASKNLDEDYKRTHKVTEWEQIAGLRNRIVHEYFKLNYDTLWKIITEEVPSLKPKI